MNTRIASFVLALALAALACSAFPIPSVNDPSPIIPALGQTATPTPTPAVSATPEDAARAYYEAWRQPDVERLITLVSDFSLERIHLTRDSLRAEFKKVVFSGMVLERYEVLESRMLDGTTALVRVVAQGHSGSDESYTEDEWIAFRLENGEWRFNLNNIVDVVPLATPGQTINGLELQPVELQRFTDQLSVAISINNHGSQKILWGLANDVIATFFFPGGSSKDLKAAYTIEPNRAYPHIVFKFEGFFEEYPTGLRLSNFMLADPFGIPQLDRERWFYDFSLVPVQLPTTPSS